MLRSVLALIALVCCIAAKSQPVLTAANNNPVPGDTVFWYFTDLPAISIPVETTTALWDYQHLPIMGGDSMYYTDCTVAPDCGTYAGANLASKLIRYSNYTYYLADTSMFAVLSGPPVTLTTDTSVMYNYPVAYGYTFYDSSRDYLAYDTMTYVTRATASGYGTLLTPTGSYDSVLLLHAVANLKIGSPTPSVRRNSDRHYYTFHKPGTHFQLLRIDADTFGTGGILLPKVATYYTDPQHPSRINSINNTTTGISLWPLPYKGSVLKLSSPDVIANSDRIVITDITGRRLAEYTAGNLLYNKNSIAITLPDMHTGMYIVTLYSKDGASSGRFNVE